MLRYVSAQIDFFDTKNKHREKTGELLESVGNTVQPTYESAARIRIDARVGRKSGRGVESIDSRSESLARMGEEVEFFSGRVSPAQEQPEPAKVIDMTTGEERVQQPEEEQTTQQARVMPTPEQDTEEANAQKSDDEAILKE